MIQEGDGRPYVRQRLPIGFGGFGYMLSPASLHFTSMVVLNAGGFLMVDFIVENGLFLCQLGISIPQNSRYAFVFKGAKNRM